MAKKTKDETIDLLYVNNKKGKEKNKNQKKKRNNNVPKETLPQNDIINLDNEIIIGLTPKPMQNKSKSSNQKVKNKTSSKEKANKYKNKHNSKGNKPKNKLTIKNKIKIKILKWTSVLVLVVAIVVLFMLSPVFDVKQIYVEGVQKLSSEEIINLSQIHLEENTFKIRKNEVIQRIQNNTYVENAEVIRELPNTVRIIVKEREPQYIIEVANGNAYIDSKGYILEISTEKLELPSLIGFETSIECLVDYENTKKLSDEDCKKIELVNQVVTAAKNNNILSYITSINIENITDIKLNLDTEKKVAYLGDCSNANIRILYLKKMIEEESGKEGEAFINGNLSKPKPYFREKV